jgi:hypothetical protein
MSENSGSPKRFPPWGQHGMDIQPILFGTTVADVVNYDFSKSNQVVVWNHEALSTSGT